MWLLIFILVIINIIQFLSWVKLHANVARYRILRDETINHPLENKLTTLIKIYLTEQWKGK